MLPSFAKHCRKKEEAAEAAQAVARVEQEAERRRALIHAKAEARARYKQGERLARRREQLGQELRSFTARELEVLRNGSQGCCATS